jgi:hypothetical protein
MPNKNPLYADKIILAKGGGIETELASDQNKNYWAASGQPVLATAGTDTAGLADRLLVTKIFIPATTVITGLAYLIGSVGGTNKAVVSLYSASGTLLASSAVAGTTVGTAANFQALDFTAPYTAV